MHFGVLNFSSVCLNQDRMYPFELRKTIAVLSVQPYPSDVSKPDTSFYCKLIMLSVEKI